MKQSNTYIFIYASVMVIAVAAILSFAAITLKPYQDKNIEIAKKLDILKSVGIAKDAGKAKNKNQYVESLYDKYITNNIVINTEGTNIDSVKAFNVNLKIELKKEIKNRSLPIYICTLDDGSNKYIIPVRGKGLWGPIWGYVALNEDYNTVFGATFAHKGETPGLGSEIDTKEFQAQFKEKKIFDASNNFASIIVIKGVSNPNALNEIDAISGGTITSKALEAMLSDCLAPYETYFKSQN